MKKIKNLDKRFVQNMAFLFLGIFVVLIALSFVITDMIQYDPKVDDFYQGVPTLYSTFKRFGTLFFFTYITNFFLGIMLIVLAWMRNSALVKRLFFISVTLITITFLVYWTLISYKAETWASFYSGFRSTITHAVNPIIGFIVLIMIRKEVIISKNTFIASIVMVMVYFLFAMILFFATYNVYAKDQGVVIYTFLNFYKPLFYKGGNTALVVILDIFVFVLAAAIPVGLMFFWKAVLRIKIECKRGCKTRSTKQA
ncbi:MAGa3780 family membrane protein [Mycoplasma simbae]|uniref:MAGa3780 family membrane protein n=1 Tax=Mycoplasma simbae TaxID=36744 RepID=UPI000A67B2EB|nr:hypothetical protein [Mycoplasma simbae]